MKGTRRTTGSTRNKEYAEGANMMKNVGKYQSFQLYFTEKGIT